MEEMLWRKRKEKEGGEEKEKEGAKAEKERGSPPGKKRKRKKEGIRELIRGIKDVFR